MPKFTFKCKKCGTSVKKYVSASKDILECECGDDLVKQMPKLAGHVQVTETIDKYSNKKWKQDQKEILEERKSDYYWSVEVPRMVQSGTYHIETMLELGWIYFDEKEEIQIRKKPPQKG